MLINSIEYRELIKCNSPHQLKKYTCFFSKSHKGLTKNDKNKAFKIVFQTLL